MKLRERKEVDYTNKRKPASSATASSVTATSAKTANPKRKKGKSAKIRSSTKSKLAQVDDFIELNGKIVESNNVTYDIMMCYVDEKSDKFYITQWGRTGQKGQKQLFGPYKEVDKAIEQFQLKFKDKTGNEHSDYISGNYSQITGKYAVLNKNTDSLVNESKGRGVIWQYYVGDGVDGKSDGWYNYDEDASDIVEGIYQAYSLNTEMQDYLTNRIVESGNFSYAVDLLQKKQRNLSTSTIRTIRRYDPSEQ
ncbi:Protein mono-ADP-ribosyltransferase parp4 [Clydaea vesicula]|uniref:Protein mono-ADP-ribosyltransferase parp4 n=1 Tax=Clydaea vesicula TaxID=447962 RepID=A0AAD5U0R7_9FUNG|nr:Protein mono-ADP-ribosyltransferase parp4 [Clydaea vesicula]